MRKMKINGVEYTFTIHRQKKELPYLLMLHGFMGDSRSFEHLLEPLSQFCNPVTIDLLGHGNSHKPYDPARYQEHHQSTDLHSFMDQLFDQPPFLYGYSMGGRLALQAISRTTGIAKGLILESTNPGIEDNEKRRQRRATDLHRADDIEEDYLKFLNQWEKLPLFESPVERDPNLDSRYREMHKSQDPKAMAASLRGFGTGSMAPITAGNNSIERPCLVLAGSNDDKYIAINKKLEYLFNNTSNCIIHAGHRVHLDNPEMLCRHIHSFIQQNQ